MTNSANTKCDSVKRCAVCKIDLKGRFVYIDKKVEKLLGYPREELFGKHIQDYICKNSIEVIEHLFSQRNSYEICYDTLNLNFKNSDNQMVNVSTVVSLNLISGNPVNYIFIITSVQDEISDTCIVSNNNVINDNLKALLQVGVGSDLKENLEYIFEFTNTKQICLYFINGEKIEPRYIVEQDNSELDMPELESLHYQVAATGETYDFTKSEDDNSLKEYVCRLNVSESENVLLRFIFDNNVDKESSEDQIDRVRLSILLFERLYSSQVDNELEQSDDINIRFVVGLLDSMNIGAVLTDFNGDIVGFNGRLKDLLGWSEINGNIREFVKQINQNNDISLETELMDNFLNSFDSPNINKCRIQLPSGENTMVTSLRLGETLDDLSSLIAFIPYYADDIRIISDNSQFWFDSIKAINKILTTSTKKNSAEFVAGIKKMLDVFDTLIEPRKVDMNVLVNDVFKKVKFSFSKKKILSRIESLPILTIKEEKIRLVLEEIFKNSIEYNDNPQPAITVRADLFADTCCLTISDNGCGMTDEDLLVIDKITERTKQGINIKKYSSGLAKVNYILRSIDGRIDITSSKSEGTTVTISFPIADNPVGLFVEPDEFLTKESKTLESSRIS